MQENRRKAQTMHMNYHSILIAAALAALPSSVWAADEHASHGGPLGRQEAVLMSITATVTDIDYTNREVTLKGPLGNEVTFVADQRIKRFNEFKVGDLVEADYYVSVAGELRKPTAEEEAHPITVLSAAAKAPPGTSPA